MTNEAKSRLHFTINYLFLVTVAFLGGHPPHFVVFQNTPHYDQKKLAISIKNLPLKLHAFYRLQASDDKIDLTF